MEQWESDIWRSTRRGKLVWVLITTGEPQSMSLFVPHRQLESGALTLRSETDKKLVIPKSVLNVQRINLGHSGKRVDAAMIDISTGTPVPVKPHDMDKWDPDRMI